MNALPFNLQQPFFTLLLEQGSLSDFETWVYNEPSLEKYLKSDDYLALISFDFKDKRSVIDIEKLINPYLDYVTYYHYCVCDTLLSLTHSPNDLKRLVQIYDWYCQGYGFFRKLALTYGLSAQHYLWDNYPKFKLKESDLKEIKEQANYLYNALVTEKIILLNPPSYDDDKEFYRELKDNSQS